MKVQTYVPIDTPEEMYERALEDVLAHHLSGWKLRRDAGELVGFEAKLIVENPIRPMFGLNVDAPAQYVAVSADIFRVDSSRLIEGTLPDWTDNDA